MNIEVQPIIGEPLRYRVPSRTHGNEAHIVDLSENTPNGSCSCTDYTARRLPKFRETGVSRPYTLDKNGNIDSESTRCFHIEACRNDFLDSVLIETSKHLKNERTPNS